MSAIVVLVVVALSAIVAFTAYRMAVRKGRSGAWAFIGLLTPLGWLIGLAILSTREPLGEAAKAEARKREEEESQGYCECDACGAPNDPAAEICRKCRAPMRPVTDTK